MTAPTLPRLSGRYGAPMGRPSFGTPEKTVLRSVYLQRVHLDSGGYDSGGAYWGLGSPLYWATDGGGYSQFIRAGSRVRAILELGIAPDYLDRLAAGIPRARLAEYAADTLPDQWGRPPSSRAPKWTGWTPQAALDVIMACGKVYLGRAWA